MCSMVWSFIRDLTRELLQIFHASLTLISINQDLDLKRLHIPSVLISSYDFDTTIMALQHSKLLQIWLWEPCYQTCESCFLCAHTVCISEAPLSTLLDQTSRKTLHSSSYYCCEKQIASLGLQMHDGPWTMSWVSPSCWDTNWTYDSQSVLPAQKHP